MEIVRALPDFTSLPKSIIHTDVHVGNVIETKTGDMYLIDCDGLAIGTRIFDL
jgi:thiamine kinase-like enzyme